MKSLKELLPNYYRKLINKNMKNICSLCENCGEKEHRERVMGANLTSTSVESLLEIAFSVADREKQGHLTILKFTTNYRVGFDTPTDIDTRKFINNLYEGKTLKSALLNFLYNEM